MTERERLIEDLKYRLDAAKISGRPKLALEIEGCIALLRADGEPVAVRALEWTMHTVDGTRWTGSQHGSRQYGVRFDGKEWLATVNMLVVGRAPSCAEAKAAAQADFEARIRSALYPAPQPDGRDAWIEECALVAKANLSEELGEEIANDIRALKGTSSPSQGRRPRQFGTDSGESYEDPACAAARARGETVIAVPADQIASFHNANPVPAKEYLASFAVERVKELEAALDGAVVDFNRLAEAIRKVSVSVGIPKSIEAELPMLHSLAFCGAKALAALRPSPGASAPSVIEMGQSDIGRVSVGGFDLTSLAPEASAKETSDVG